MGFKRRDLRFGIIAVGIWTGAMALSLGTAATAEQHAVAPQQAPIPQPPTFVPITIDAPTYQALVERLQELPIRDTAIAQQIFGILQGLEQKAASEAAKAPAKN